jgi:L-2,4-diaminobutyrate decarboxylase
LFGRQLFEDMVDSTFDLGRTFYEKLSESNDFEPLHEPECNIVAFTHIPSALKAADGATREQFLFEVRRELIRSGEFYIVQANIGGTQALRVTIINPLTTADHLDGLLDAIRRIGQNVANRFSATTG